MFGIFGSKKNANKAVDIVYQPMILTLGHLRGGPMADDLFSDLERSPYHCGYLQGKMAALLACLVKGGEMNVRDGDSVLSSVFTKILGESKSMRLLKAMKEHEAASGADHQRGKDRGIKIGLYSAGVRDVAKDSDFSLGIRRAEEVREMSKGNAHPQALHSEDDKRMSAVLGLEFLWFIENSGGAS